MDTSRCLNSSVKDKNDQTDGQSSYFILRSKRPEVRVLSGVPSNHWRQPAVLRICHECRSSCLAHGMLYVRLRAWRYPARLRSVSAPAGGRAAVLPATRPCSGCRLPPVVRLRPNRRPRRSPGRPGGLRVVFRRDSKVDAFQRQISALRHQLGGENDGEAVPDRDRPRLH